MKVLHVLKPGTTHPCVETRYKSSKLSNESLTCVETR